MAEKIARLKHFRHKYNYCNRGLRQEFTKHGLSWNDLVSKGLPVSAFDHIEDARFKEVMEIVRDDHGQK